MNIADQAALNGSPRFHPTSGSLPRYYRFHLSILQRPGRTGEPGITMRFGETPPWMTARTFQSPMRDSSSRTENTRVIEKWRSSRIHPSCGVKFPQRSSSRANHDASSFTLSVNETSVHFCRGAAAAVERRCPRSITRHVFFPRTLRGVLFSITNRSRS